MTDIRVYFGFDVHQIFIYDRKLEVIDYPTKNIAGLVSDSIDDKGVMETIRRAGPYIKNKLINRINY
jgi:hypothetical protein